MVLKERTEYIGGDFVHSYCACYSSRLSLSIYLSNLPLKPFTVVASITSLGRSFHVSTTLWLKKFPPVDSISYLFKDL